MYESYAWPRANFYRRDKKTIVKLVHDLFTGLIKRIEEKERKIS